MRLSVSCWLLLLPSLLCLRLCEAQGLGGPTQQSNQNNFGKKKREIVSKIITAVETKAKSSRVEEVTAFEHDLDVASRAKVEIFVGSPCDRNNFGRKKRSIVEAMVGLSNNLAKKEKREAQGQNCVNSLCNQNNFGRKKRAVVKAIVKEA